MVVRRGACVIVIPSSEYVLAWGVVFGVAFALARRFCVGGEGWDVGGMSLGGAISIEGEWEGSFPMGEGEVGGDGESSWRILDIWSEEIEEGDMLSSMMGGSVGGMVM